MFDKLPRYVILALFHDWLSFSGICRLDSATCNHGTRDIFLNQIQQCDFEFSLLCSQEDSKAYVAWVIRRGLFGSPLNLVGISKFHLNLLLRFNHYFNKVKSIILECPMKYEGDSHIKLIQNCKELNSIEISNKDYVNNEALYPFIKLSSNISTLIIKNVRSLNDLCANLIAKTCTQLISFGIVGSGCVTAKGISGILKKNSNLKKLTLTNNRNVDDVQMMDAIDRYCLQIEELDYTVNAESNQTVATELLHPHLDTAYSVLTTFAKLRKLNLNAMCILNHLHKFESLRELHIYYSVCFYDHEHSVNKEPNQLEQLTITANKISTITQAMLHNCRNLRSFTLNNVYFNKVGSNWATVCLPCVLYGKIIENNPDLQSLSFDNITIAPVVQKQCEDFMQEEDQKPTWTLHLLTLQNMGYTETNNVLLMLLRYLVRIEIVVIRKIRASEQVGVTDVLSRNVRENLTAMGTRIEDKDGWAKK